MTPSEIEITLAQLASALEDYVRVSTVLAQ